MENWCSNSSVDSVVLRKKKFRLHSSLFFRCKYRSFAFVMLFLLSNLSFFLSNILIFAPEKCCVFSLLFIHVNLCRETTNETVLSLFFPPISHVLPNRRNAEKQFVAETDEIEPGTEWERIAKLCDFNPKTNKSSKDISRMRSIILQLKQNPISTSKKV